MEKKLDGNYTRMLQVIFNKSWRQHPTKQQLYGHLPPITKTMKVRHADTQDTAGEAGTSWWIIFSYGPLHMAEKKQGDQLESTYSSSVRIRDVALRTCQKRWMIGRSGERGSGITVLEARQDDDDDYQDMLRFDEETIMVIFFCSYMIICVDKILGNECHTFLYKFRKFLLLLLFWHYKEITWFFSEPFYFTVRFIFLSTFPWEPLCVSWLTPSL